MQVIEREAKQLRPYQGVVLFVIVVVALIFVAAPIQRLWGMYGVALTEVILLLLGVIPALLLKTDLRQVFPFSKPTFRQLGGTFIFWLGSYIAVLLITIIITFLFPESLLKVSGGLQNTITSVPMGIAFFITAVMPAICEEVLHRGFILNSFAVVKNKWVTIFWMGIIFGIFHLDLVRFLPTAVLGMALTYLMLETQNLIYPIFLHFINNALSTFISFFSKSSGALETNMNMSEIFTLQVVAAYLVIGSVTPLLILLGASLVKPKVEISSEEERLLERKRKNTKILIAVSVAAAMFFSGTVIILISQWLG